MEDQSHAAAGFGCYISLHRSERLCCACDIVHELTLSSLCSWWWETWRAWEVGHGWSGLVWSGYLHRLQTELQKSPPSPLFQSSLKACELQTCLCVALLFSERKKMYLYPGLLNMRLYKPVTRRIYICGATWQCSVEKKKKYSRLSVSHVLRGAPAMDIIVCYMSLGSRWPTWGKVVKAMPQSIQPSCTRAVSPVSGPRPLPDPLKHISLVWAGISARSVSVELGEGYSMFLFPTCQLCIRATFGLFPSNLILPRITGLDQKKTWKKIQAKHTV